MNLYLQVKLCFKIIQFWLTVKSACFRNNMGTIQIIRSGHSVIPWDRTDLNSIGRIMLALNEADFVVMTAVA